MEIGGGFGQFLFSFQKILFVNHEENLKEMATMNSEVRYRHRLS